MGLIDSAKDLYGLSTVTGDSFSATMGDAAHKKIDTKEVQFGKDMVNPGTSTSSGDPDEQFTNNISKQVKDKLPSAQGLNFLPRVALGASQGGFGGAASAVGQSFGEMFGKQSAGSFSDLMPGTAETAANKFKGSPAIDGLVKQVVPMVNEAASNAVASSNVGMIASPKRWMDNKAKKHGLSVPGEVPGTSKSPDAAELSKQSSFAYRIGKHLANVS